MLISHFRLNAPPRAAVFDDHYFTFYINTHIGQFFVIGRQAIVYKNQFAGNIAIGAPGVIGGQLAGLTRSGIFF